MNVGFVVKGGGRNTARILKSLPDAAQDSFLDSVLVRVTEKRGHAIALTQDLVGQVDCVIAIGGDGTLNEVVNGVLSAQRVPDTAMPLVGVVATGTANDYVKSTPLKGTLEEVLSLLRANTVRTIDVGRVYYQDRHGNPSSRYFLNMADLGIGADVVLAVNRGKRFLGPTLTFLQATLRAFYHFSPPALKIRCAEGYEWEGNSFAIVAGKGGYFGSGICIAPHARLDDGSLALTIVGDISLKDFLLKLRKLRRGQAIDHPEVHYRHTQRLEVSALSGRAPAETDGESLGYCPLVVEVLPRALSFLMPPTD